MTSLRRVDLLLPTHNHVDYADCFDGCPLNVDIVDWPFVDMTSCIAAALTVTQIRPAAVV